ncbi:hypothetical protein M1D80_11090 [Phyllobacteriaceae bacterium JZ32]
MTGELKTIKFQMMLSETEAREIDDWGFQNRIRSRAEAIRRLTGMALRVDRELDQLVEQQNKIFEHVMSRSRLIADTAKSEGGEWDLSAKMMWESLGELIEMHAALALALTSIAGQVRHMRSGEDIDVINSRANAIKAEVDSRTQIMKETFEMLRERRPHPDREKPKP